MRERMMRIVTKLVGVLSVLAVSGSVVACSKDKPPENADDQNAGPMEKAGESVDEAADDTKEAVEEAAEDVGEAADDAVDAVKDAG
jgi:hypothetical protein